MANESRLDKYDANGRWCGCVIRFKPGHTQRATGVDYAAGQSVYVEQFWVVGGDPTDLGAPAELVIAREWRKEP